MGRLIRRFLSPPSMASIDTLFGGCRERLQSGLCFYHRATSRIRVRSLLEFLQQLCKDPAGLPSPPAPEPRVFSCQRSLQRAADDVYCLSPVVCYRHCPPFNSGWNQHQKFPPIRYHPAHRGGGCDDRPPFTSLHHAVSALPPMPRPRRAYYRFRRITTHRGSSPCPCSAGSRAPALSPPCRHEHRGGCHCKAVPSSCCSRPGAVKLNSHHCEQCSRIGDYSTASGVAVDGHCTRAPLVACLRRLRFQAI